MLRQPIHASPARNGVLALPTIAPAKSESRKLLLKKEGGRIKPTSKDNIASSLPTRRRSYVFDATMLDEKAMSPTLKTAKLKRQNNLVTFRDKPATMVQAVGDLTTVNEKVVLWLLERFQTLQEHAGSLGDLLQPEHASRWELMQQLLWMIEAAVYKVGKLHNCLVRKEDALTLKHPCGSTSAFEALPSLRFQLQRIQQLTMNINASLREKWTVEEITEALGDEAETLCSIPVHFGQSAMLTKQQ
eukprot:GEMP01017516.1.p1 GENE.GEMP01017516.1~~GEMP01017516.1.p1  ORF type:complete len:245 (+),score=64.81 GEMP01017516.1:98-832(+)